MNSFSVVIPVFNEEKNIKILFDDLLYSIQKNYIFQLIFVDDGSTDGSKKILKKISSFKYCDTEVVSLESNSGQSFAIKKGIEITTILFF